MGNINFRKDFFILIPQFIIGITFLLSAVTKIPSFNSFVNDLSLVPDAGIIIPVFAVVLIVIELIIAASLLLNVKADFSLNVTAVLVILFILFNAYSFLTENNSACGCFGNFIETNKSEALIIDLILFAFVLVSLKIREFNFKKQLYGGSL